MNTLRTHPLIPTTRFPILSENPDPLATLPLEIVTCAEASKTVPSAKALKEAIASQPALISAPKDNFPEILAQYLAADPEPEENPNPQYKDPLA